MSKVQETIHNEIRAVYAREHADGDVNIVIGQLWDKYPAHKRFINAVHMLYAQVPRGTEVAGVWLGQSAAGRRQYQMLVSWRGEVSRVTGYMVAIGIGRETKRETLSTTSYASDLVMRLGQFLYDDEYSLKSRSY